MKLENFKNGYDVTLGSSLALNEKNDCAVRAFANAFSITYNMAHKFAEEVFDRKPKKGVKSMFPKLAKLGFAQFNMFADSLFPETIPIAKSPDSKILLLAIFPRSAKASDPQRINNQKASTLISKLAKDDTVTYLDINERFLLADGTLSQEIMPDLLHPKQKGYAIWAEALEPTLQSLLTGGEN